MRSLLIRILQALVIVAVATAFANAGDFVYFKQKAVAAAGGGTPLFADGFESNDFSSWDSETDAGSKLSVDATVAKNGTHSLKWLRDAAGTGYVTKNLTDNNIESWSHFWIRFSDVSDNAVASSNTQEMTEIFVSGATTAIAGVGFAVNTADPRVITYVRAYYKNAAGTFTSNGSSSQTFNADTWYEITAYFKCMEDGTGISRLWLGSTLIQESTNLDFYAGSTLGRHRVGALSSGWTAWSAPGVTYYIDDYQVAGSNIWW